MYAVFENRGILDMRALTVMGVNSKPNTDNPIGYFGTGLKYAIAVLARMGVSIVVQDGKGNTFELFTKRENFREKDFNFVYMRDKFTSGMLNIQLPFTTELGKDWELWQAVRELECNVRDEAGSFFAQSDYPEPEEGIVRFIVSNSTAATSDLTVESLENSQMNTDLASKINLLRNTIFFDMIEHKTRHDLNEKVQAIEVRSGAMYANNVLAGTNADRKNCFIYNYKGSVVLTEDRTLKYPYQVQSVITHAILASPDTYVLEHILSQDEIVGEWDWFGKDVYIPLIDVSDAARDVLTQRYTSGKKLNQYMLALMRHQKISREMIEGGEMSPNERDMLDEAIDILTERLYPVDEYKIVFVDDLGDSVMGRADMEKKIIYISRYSFEQGLENVMGTLIEEWAHIKFDFSDETRRMQDWLLRQIVVQIQRARRTERVPARRSENTTRHQAVDRKVDGSDATALSDSTTDF